MAGIIKDAGDDPDVTHGALVTATVRRGERGRGVRFEAGEGVGTVTRAGLPVPPGEPAINPGPRAMIAGAMSEVAAAQAAAATWWSASPSPRRGARPAHPQSAPWHRRRPLDPWHHRHRRAVLLLGLDPFDPSRHRRGEGGGPTHVAGATGSTSEAAVARWADLPDVALIDMGDFVGGMLNILLATIACPGSRVAGGFAKMTKLAQGFLDLHSRSGAVDLTWLADRLAALGARADVVAAAARANTAAEVLGLAQAADLHSKRGGRARSPSGRQAYRRHRDGPRRARLGSARDACWRKPRRPAPSRPCQQEGGRR